jgi:hypothetical protein
MCQEEMSVAESRHVAILTVSLGGCVRRKLKGRMFANLAGLTRSGLEAKLAELAAKISVRARLYKAIEMLDSPDDPDGAVEVAQFVYDADRTLIAESLEHIAQFYRPEATGPRARHWMVQAVEKAGTREAKLLLERFASVERASPQCHPLPVHSIREAIDHLGTMKTRP